MRCGKCKQLDVSIDHVRECYLARPDAEVNVEANEGNVPRRGENFFVTPTAQRLYDAGEEENEYWRQSKNTKDAYDNAREGRGKVDFSVGREQPKAQAQPRQADSQPPVRPATERQCKYIADLRERKGLDPLKFTGSTKQASEEITRLQGMRNVQRTPNYAQTVAEIEDGIYKMDGNIYKVIHAVHGSGHQYAKMLSVIKVHDKDLDALVDKGSFTKVSGVMHKLRPEMLMPLEEALEFGKLYGFCVRCGKTLTREDSIERGMGSKCYGIMNGDF